MKAFPRASRFAVSAFVAVGALSAMPAFADTTWHWQYTGTGLDASGTFIASDAADASGFHQITAITGTRNGEAITGLYPTGQVIPGNEPFAIDNLVRLGEGQITVHGFGFATASGYANPYYVDFADTPVYSEVFTTQSSFSEVPITFSATAVPEPESAVLMLAGLGTLFVTACLRRRHERMNAI